MSAQQEPGHFPDRFYGDQSGEIHLNGSLLYLDGAATGITAQAGGGQANAVQLTEAVNQVTVVATIADSIKLPAGYGGTLLCVANEAANSLDVYPAAGDQINGAGANVAYALAGGHSAVFVCFSAGDWRAISGT